MGVQISDYYYPSLTDGLAAGVYRAWVSHNLSHKMSDRREWFSGMPNDDIYFVITPLAQGGTAVLKVNNCSGILSKLGPFSATMSGDAYFSGRPSSITTEDILRVYDFRKEFMNYKLEAHFGLKPVLPVQQEMIMAYLQPKEKESS